MNTATEGVLRGSCPRQQYVSQDVLNIHLQGIKERAASEEKITDARFDRLEAILEKNTAEIKSEIKVMNERIDRNLAEYKAVAGDIRTEISDIRGDVKALNARVDSFQHRRYWDIAWVGIVIGAVIGLIQMFSK